MSKKEQLTEGLKGAAHGVVFGLGVLAGAAAAAYVFVLVDKQ